MNVGDIVHTVEEFQSLPYGTVLIDGDGTDRRDLFQIDGIGYTDEPSKFPGRYTGYVLWDRSDRWLAFDEVGPLRIIHIPGGQPPASPTSHSRLAELNDPLDKDTP